MKRFAILLLLLFASVHAASDGVVNSVVKAPITPDGNVAGAPTDLVINLDTSLDPDFDGRPLPTGCAVVVTLPDPFRWTGLPVQDVFTPMCAPGDFQCTTAVFLQGWPQHPILPAGEYALTSSGPNTLVFTALSDLMVPNANAAPGPGLKQIHVINGFTNPRRPGSYPVYVDFTAGPGCTAESGVANVEIVPIRPSVEVTSAFNSGAPNTIYQQTTVNTVAPLVWDLLLWDRDGGPMDGVTVEMVDSDSALLLRQGNNAVGNIRIHAPDGAVGHSVAGGPSFVTPAPVKGVPTGRLKVQFTAGSAPGVYTTTVTMHHGNALNMFVDAL
jgi:hypothetical protein